MAVIAKDISLLDEDQNLKINYTCMTDMLNIELNIKDFDISGTDELRLYLKKTDELVYVAGEPDIERNSVLFGIPANCFPASGETLGQLRIGREDKKLYSNRIRMNIHPYYGG